MRNFLFHACLFFILGNSVFAQIPRDTLQEITIQAYSADRPLQEVSASVGLLTPRDFSKFNNTTIVSAVNTVPGVRMEERSPGSYRFSIRGSLLRSPFGVRNVKAYWNGLPLTDAGGNTYLNLIDNNAIGKIEIIKGPAGSLYGANTGGAILLSSAVVDNSQVELGSSIGSYGLLRNDIGLHLKGEKMNTSVRFARQTYDGYRQQSAMKRSALNADFTFLLTTSSTLTASLFYTDLFYETPGGLTLTQYQADPKQARPAAGPNKSAIEQKAAIYNRTPFAGIVYENDWENNWLTTIALAASYSDFRNPAIRNFEQRTETNLSLRNENHYQFENRHGKGKIVIGGEIQNFDSPVKVHDNLNGSKDTLQTRDELNATMGMLFFQGEVTLPAEIILTLGTSINFSRYNFLRTSPASSEAEKKFNPVISPRIAVLKKFTEKVSVYANASRGFSPPTFAEVRPSANVFNDDLQAEKGFNLEAGLRGHILKNFYLDLAYYNFILSQTIVIRHLDDGAEYFINAGKTNQSGIEAQFTWKPVSNSSGFLSDMKFWGSYSYNNYHFKNYSADTLNISGNELTGVPPVVFASGMDLTLKQRLTLNVTSQYVDHIPLNDLNTAYANEYFLLGLRLAYSFKLSSVRIDAFAGVDNALDKVYSLGNDLNALGGRFYNAAAGRNFYGGLKINLGL